VAYTSLPPSHDWNGKTVLITGVCGTVGSQLLRRLLRANPAEVVGLDNHESGIFLLQQRYRDYRNLRFYLADVRDRDTLIHRMRGIQIVLHAAALKHVLVCENAPYNAVSTNIVGVQNVIDAAMAASVERVIFTSSDKAVNPTNVMGTSKLMGERLITAANAYRRGPRPLFASTRFGNVLGSSGSVIPVFRKQIRVGGPVTLTDPEMTRFIMTLREAAELVMYSTFLAQGGEVFVTKMPVVRIEDLAAVMIEELAPRYGHDPQNIRIQHIGVHPGEKLYEELLTSEELRRTFELEHYFVVQPAFEAIYKSTDRIYPGMRSSTVDRPYNSAVEEAMDRESLRAYLRTSGLLEEGEST
jgi:FlaA1/EpsC-like NDP-sugar epimerase